MRTVHLLMPCLPRRCDALVGEVVRAPPTVAVVRLLDEMSDTVSALHSCRGCSSYLRRLSRGRIAAIAANAANAVSHPCPLPPRQPTQPPGTSAPAPACLPACLPAAVPGAGRRRVLPQCACGCRVAARGGAGAKGHAKGRSAMSPPQLPAPGAWAGPPADITSSAFSAASAAAV